MLHNLHRATSQLYLNKTGKKNNEKKSFKRKFVGGVRINETFHNRAVSPAGILLGLSRTMTLQQPMALFFFFSLPLPALMPLPHLCA